MSAFINNDITNDGRILIAKNYLGQRMNFTRIVMGDGYMPPGVEPREMTDAVHAVVSVPIIKLKINADGTVVIGGMFSNSDVTAEFFYRELALFAEGEDGVEVLYCYGNAGEFAERITPFGGSSVIEKSIDIITAVGSTEYITATIVRTTTADEISYDDSVSQLGAESVQDAIDILAQNIGEDTPVIIVSETEPAEPCAIWLQPAGQNVEMPLFYYLAYYYDRANQKFVPFSLMNVAQNVLMYPGGTETVADAIENLQTAGDYTLAELNTHTGDTGIHVIPGQVNNIITEINEINRQLAALEDMSGWAQWIRNGVDLDILTAMGRY